MRHGTALSHGKLGDADFCRDHAIRYPYVGRPMAKGISLVEVLRASGKLMGGIPRPDFTLHDMFARGYDFVIASADVLLCNAAPENQLENAPGDKSAHV